MRTRVESATIPADLLPRVERFTELLEEKLDVFQSFEIEAVLSAGTVMRSPTVQLRMGVRDNEGEMRWDHDRCLEADDLGVTDVALRRLASHIVYRFTDHLSAVVGENLQRMLAEMRRREPVAVGE